jgi:hypothetical protein
LTLSPTLTTHSGTQDHLQLKLKLKFASTMTIFVGIVLLLAVWVEASNNAANNASEAPTRPKFRERILSEQGVSFGILEIEETQEPADAVFAFSKQHGLDSMQRHRLLDHICQSLTCSRREALLWSIPVEITSNAVKTFELYEGIEPADAVHQFITQHNLTETYRQAIMSRACSVVECKRLEPGEKSVEHKFFQLQF